MNKWNKTVEPELVLKTENSKEQILNLELEFKNCENNCINTEKENHPAVPKHNEQKDESRNDKFNMVLLIFLYILQGVQFGITSSIKMIIQNKGATYDDQAQFSMIRLPFAIKILWAPIMDSISSPKFGKRKLCIIPVQYTLGLTLFITSMNIDNWLGDTSIGEKPNINILTIVFLFCIILTAIQDVAVDGWSLTLLSRKNIGHMSTCSSIGSNVGYYLGHTVFITLDSADFCNKWIRSTALPTGIVPVANALCFWAVVCIVSTTLLAFFKKEEIYKFDKSSEEVVLNVKQSYVILWEIFKLKPIRQTALLLITSGFLYAVSDAVVPLKFLEYGVPREKIAMLETPLLPVLIGLPFLLKRFILSNQPMNLFLNLIPFWLIKGILMATLIFFTPIFVKNYELPMIYLILLLLLHACHEIMGSCFYLSSTSYFARITDPRCASTYITLLYAVGNMTHRLSSSFAIFMVNKLTLTKCFLIFDTTRNMECETIVDGLYIETAFCTFYGFFWLIWAKKKYRELQDLDRKEWLLDNSVY